MAANNLAADSPWQGWDWTVEAAWQSGTTGARVNKNPSLNSALNAGIGQANGTFNPNYNLLTQIFKKHAVSDSLFYTSYSFYETHPEQLKILMDSLTSVFTKLQSAAVLLEGDESKEEPVVQKQNEIRDNPNNPFNEEQQKIWNERKKNIREKVEKEKLEKIKKDNPGQ